MTGDEVTLRHPDLPPDQTITVPAAAVPHHQAAGWQPADEAPAEQSAEDGGDSTPVAQPKRRRTQKED
jgi:hypothetical protein